MTKREKEWERVYVDKPKTIPELGESANEVEHFPDILLHVYGIVFSLDKKNVILKNDNFNFF